MDVEQLKEDVRQGRIPAERLVDIIVTLHKQLDQANRRIEDLERKAGAVLVAQLRTFDYDPEQSFRAWLKTIAMNKWRERLRRPAMRSLEAADIDEPMAPDADSVWDREYRFQLVLRGFEAIKSDFQPHTWQACYELVVRGRRVSEVAAELGLSSAAIYTAKHRVLERLRKELEGMIE